MMEIGHMQTKESHDESGGINKALTNISEEWLNIIYKDETKQLLDRIYEQVRDDLEHATPSIENWFNWCRATPLNNIKIVILGQDPYFKAGWAHGLSFSCLSGVPPSLKNIYKCLLRYKLIHTIPKHGDLTSWSTQGILLLNSALSTKIGKAGDHMGMWLPYTQLIIKKICKYHYNNGEQLIFMLWGKFAQNFHHFIDCDFHIILNWLHPSPLAQRVSDKKLLFTNCDHFLHANTFLTDDDKKPIDWNSINKINIDKPDKPKKSDKPDKPKKSNKSKKYVDAKSILDINLSHYIAFTDGGCHPNNKSAKSRAGWALVFVSGHLKDKLVYGNLDVDKHSASNIRAEGMAIIRSLEEAYASPHDWKKLTIITDCKFWVDMIETFMPRWDKNTFAEKSNPDLTKRMWSMYKKLSKKKEIQFMHVKSHNKDGWSSFEDGSFEKFCYIQNDYVDKMCNFARLNLEPKDEICTIVEYE